MKSGITYNKKPCPKFFKKKKSISFKKEIRESDQCKEWVCAVFERDDYTCQCCKRTNTFLNAHHIKPFAQIIRENNITTYEEAMVCAELWDVGNGVTLCEKCHKKKHRGE
jgi:5-methylcytosine-specific restriction endonuclease McrA